jgi:hypothetical protein
MQVLQSNIGKFYPPFFNLNLKLNLKLKLKKCRFWGFNNFFSTIPIFIILSLTP